ncbi:MAG TPA: histidinol phosphate phosphatase domain-containing protein [Nitrospirae bacterium]|nr:DNA polymerase/3'-5' exonuclease PolX [bacterium BMS3Abin10]GBE37693.1 DNA polymerase/3'-5' exonuclease PolX [bacterium BMS3Bbin08]HDH50556.1 histidinol phosphate phosphatase domain-containing protein [Nitrospirota bacterium]HDK16810.1 histidinol phosphate phosphatase domain-containing protein [Nitrospirota bacterium]HDK82243.1 histidinol phosphate phosphatase domain-containing protein [Nitrospirota bacterium]
MIDLHTHTLFSDGELLPSELVRRACYIGYKALAITDHVDTSNIDFVIPRVAQAIEDISKYSDIKIIPGVEITHVPPELIGKLVTMAREFGAKVVIVHGETVVEPVAEGTNSAAIEAGADILSHPGLISKEDAVSAKNKGVALEITSRKGHSLSNGHVAKTALEVGADLVINTDSHAPEDLITLDRAEVILRSAGIAGDSAGQILRNSRKIIDKIFNEKS